MRVSIHAYFYHIMILIIAFWIQIFKKWAKCNNENASYFVLFYVIYCCVEIYLHQEIILKINEYYTTI